MQEEQERRRQAAEVLRKQEEIMERERQAQQAELERVKHELAETEVSSLTLLSLMIPGKVVRICGKEALHSELSRARARCVDADATSRAAYPAGCVAATACIQRAKSQGADTPSGRSGEPPAPSRVRAQEPAG